MVNNNSYEIECRLKNDQLTPEERQSRARAAGKASAKARRERKTIRDHLLMLLSEGEIQNNITVALIQKAIGGDVRAFEVIRDTIGEKPNYRENCLYNGTSSGVIKVVLTDE